MSVKIITRKKVVRNFHKNGRINYQRGAISFKCIRMAHCGFSQRYIASQCALTIGQVSYRLRQMDTKIKRYRNGEGPIAEKVIKAFIEK